MHHLVALTISYKMSHYTSLIYIYLPQRGGGGGYIYRENVGKSDRYYRGFDVH